MSWLGELYNVYNSHEGKAGVPEIIGNREVTLLPLSHTSQTAHIEVTINEDGTFNSAEVLDKVVTLIPTTEQSSSRAGSAIFPYPLHDKLSYVAGDLINYGGDEKAKTKAKVQFSAYIKQLKKWSESEHATTKVKAIYKYLSEEHLLADLVSQGILVLDSNNELITKWKNGLEKLYGEKPLVYSKVTGEIVGAFVRFNIYSPTKLLDKVWEDTEQFQSFIKYYNRHLGQEDICYVTGERGPITERHANKIRHSGDKAKLISSNDTTWFTFRGRFNKSLEAAAIGYDVSQKAHNALKWLISRQGTSIDGRVFLVWGNQKDITNEASPLVDSMDMFGTTETDITENTLEIYSSEIRKALWGYQADLKTDAKVFILILDAATPGRMSVQFYREFEQQRYLENLEAWHTKCSWIHSYRKNPISKKTLTFEGAPSARDIAMAAYGSHANDKLIKGLVERILPTIIEGRAIPYDVIQSCVNRAKNPSAMEIWEWRKTLSIACAVLNHKEGTGVALNTETTDRSYLFGRLLAIGDHLEGFVLFRQGEKRQTTAQRLMSSFSNRPKDTWESIYKNLNAYKARLSDKGRYYDTLMAEVIDQFEFEAFNNKRLDGVFLQGYSSQLLALRKKKDHDSLEGENE